MGMQGVPGGGPVVVPPVGGASQAPSVPGQVGTGGTVTGIAALTGDYGATNWGSDPSLSGLLSGPGVGTLPLTGVQRDQLRQIAFGAVNGMPSSELQGRWSSFVSEMASKGGAIDPNVYIQTVLREAYLENTEDLRMYAEKVKYFNETKKVLRDYLKQLRDCSTAWKEHCKAKGLPLERPTDGSKAREWDDAAASFFSDYASKHPTTTTQPAPSIWNLAQIDATNVCLDRAAELVQQKYGTPLPDEIKGQLKAALGPPRDEVKLREALKTMAGYLSYLGDCGVKDGQFGRAPGSCDDTAYHMRRAGYDPPHATPTPSWQDFTQRYLSPHNRTARTNLASGDIKIIEAAFGLPGGSLHGNSTYEQIVQAALSPVGDAWKNQILYGTRTSSAEVADLIAAGNTSNPAVVKMFGSEQAAYEWYHGNVDGLDPMKRQIFMDQAIPGSVPPGNVRSQQQLEDKIKEFEDKLNNVGDDAQLANVELQQNLQKQQQTLQMLSNVSKMFHDTALAVIRKIAG